jgi:predicted RNase H-like nuclease
MPTAINQPSRWPEPVMIATPLAGWCKSGWIAVIFQPDAFGPAEVKVFDTFANLVGWLQPDSIIAVDMPIGLPERAIKGGRAPDWAARTEGFELLNPETRGKRWAIGA